MKRKKRNLVVTGVIVAVMLMVGTPVFSASYESLYGCLKNLSGWKGDKPTGMQANMGGMNMITANRAYHRSGKKLTATIILGQQALGMLPALSAQKERTMDTPKGKMIVKKIKGAYVRMFYDKGQKQGMVLVPLNSGKKKAPAVFAFHFEGLSLEEGQALAESFDWKDMREKLKALK